MQPLMIGVSGMRGTIGGSLTPAVVSQMSAALAVWLKQSTQPQNGNFYRLFIGRDSRPNGK